MQDTPRSDRMIRIETVCEKTGYSVSRVYRKMADGTFPKQRRLAHRLVVWSEREVDQHINEQLHGQDAAA